MNHGLLHCEKLCVGFAAKGRSRRVLLQDLDFTVQAGEVVALLGRNGAGKSTLLRTWAGVQKPLAGKVFLQNQDTASLTPRRLAQSIAWVTPLRDSMPGLTGWEVVALGRQPRTAWHGRLGAEDHLAIEAALRHCGAEAYALRPLADLSDGERQRLLLARAIAQETPVLLLDEPTAFLDRPGRALVFRLTRELAREKGCGVVISTHDLDLALLHADRVLLLHQSHGIQGSSQDPTLREIIDKAFEA
jgi:iron complex transport system ATP-binding protein